MWELVKVTTRGSLAVWVVLVGWGRGSDWPLAGAGFAGSGQRRALTDLQAAGLGSELAGTGLTASGDLYAEAVVHVRGVEWQFSTEAV
jgi:hypothetical protein